MMNLLAVLAVCLATNLVSSPAQSQEYHIVPSQDGSEFSIGESETEAQESDAENSSYDSDTLPMGGDTDWSSDGGRGGYAYKRTPEQAPPSNSYGSTGQSSANSGWQPSNPSDPVSEMLQRQQEFDRQTVANAEFMESLRPEPSPGMKRLQDQRAASDAAVQEWQNEVDFFVRVADQLHRLESDVSSRHHEAEQTSMQEFTDISAVSLPNSELTDSLFPLADVTFILTDAAPLPVFSVAQIQSTNPVVVNGINTVLQKLQVSPGKTRNQKSSINASVSLLEQADLAAVAGDVEIAEALIELANVLADIATSLPPGIGFARDVYEATTGTNLVTGEALSTWEWSVAVVGVVSGGTGSSAVKGTKSAAQIAKLVDRILAGRVISNTAGLPDIASIQKMAEQVIAARAMTPDTRYIQNGYEYLTDPLGRVVSVSGSLKLEKAASNSYQQRLVRDAIVNYFDHAGHLIASRFGGFAEKINLVPMEATLNNGAFKKLENEWMKALEQGKSVSVKVEPVYLSPELRPDRIRIEYSIDGNTVDLTWINQPLN